MTAQLELFTGAHQRFLEFHQANPHVYRLFCRFADELLARGFRRYSSDAILHRIRWHMHVETTGADGFALNDHFTAHYARLWLADHPGHGGFFEIRRERRRTP